MKSEKLITNKPWWWFLTGKKWGTVAMTFGNRVYIHPKDIREDILVHERVHIKQNKGKWYISLWFLIRSTIQPKFYKQLELEAYIAQYDYLRNINK